VVLPCRAHRNIKGAAGVQTLLEFLLRVDEGRAAQRDALARRGILNYKK
jgi:hypothetical protein